MGKENTEQEWLFQESWNLELVIIPSSAERACQTSEELQCCPLKLDLLWKSIRCLSFPGAAKIYLGIRCICGFEALPESIIPGWSNSSDRMQWAGTRLII